MEQDELAFRLRGTFRAHTDRVNAIAACKNDHNAIVTSSHDNSAIVWSLTKENGKNYAAVPRHHLTGHSDSVNDVVISGDGNLAVSASSDRELRLWDLHTGTTLRRLVGYAGGVISAAFSVDGRQITSVSCDGSIKLWNTTTGECNHTIENAQTNGVVSCVRFSPNPTTFVSASSDYTMKVWKTSDDGECSSITLKDQVWRVDAVAISPDGSLCAGGGAAGYVLMWSLDEGHDFGERLYSLDVDNSVHALCFCPNRYWMCTATYNCIQVFDLESKSIVAELRVNDDDEFSEEDDEEKVDDGEIVFCSCLKWSADGIRLFGGYTDGTVRVWEITEADGFVVV